MGVAVGVGVGVGVPVVLLVGVGVGVSVSVVADDCVAGILVGEGEGVVESARASSFIFVLFMAICASQVAQSGWVAGTIFCRVNVCPAVRLGVGCLETKKTKMFRRRRSPAKNEIPII